MPTDDIQPGRLIALDGNGLEVMSTARRLLRSARDGRGGGISQWDASSIFHELRRNDPAVGAPSPRTLVLLYAADLAFRLRWEIRPALDEGKTVVAAPYVETAIAFGRAVGMSRKWLTALFEFAPPAHSSYRVPRNDSAAWMGKPSGGYLEFCALILKNAREPSELRDRFEAYLAGLEKRGRCRSVTEQLLVAAGVR